MCICEGYATAASIHEATGYAVGAAFSAGNLLPVAKALRNKYPNVQLIICSDADKNRVGETKARKAATAVGGIVVLPTFGPDQSSGLTDFNDLHKQAGLEAVKEQIDQGRDSQNSQDSQGVHVISEPEPLRRPMPPPEPFPLDALGPILGGAAGRIHSVIGAPAAMVGQSWLAAASLAAQPLADVEIDGRREPISLWCMTVGVSGERKSAVDTQVLMPHREFERKALDGYKCEKQKFDTESQAYETIKRGVTNGKREAKEKTSIKDELIKIGNPPDPPLKPLLLISSPTIEGIHKQFIGGLPSLGLFNDDAGEFIGGHSMSAENRTKTASGLSRLWDCGEFDRIRASDGAEKHYGKRLALHLMLQPVIAELVLSDDLLVGQGFLARCLLTWPASTIGTRPYVEANLTQTAEVIRYSQRIRQLLSIRAQLRDGSRNELEPRTLILEEDAKNTWKDIYDAIERDMGDSGPWATVRAWASKAAAQLLRIAAVLSLVENPNTGVIRNDAIVSAGLLINHYLSEAVRIVGTSSVPTPIRHAEQLLDWCHSTGREYLCSSDALQLGPNVIRTNQAFKIAVGELERTGWARRIDGGRVIDGVHRKHVWKIEGKR